MTLLMPYVPAAGLAPGVLDYAQVSERTSYPQTSAVTGSLRVPDPSWNTPLERARLISDALGGETDPDEVEQRAFAAVFEAQLRPAEPTRTSYDTLPTDL